MPDLRGHGAGPARPTFELGKLSALRGCGRRRFPRAASQTCIGSLQTFLARTESGSDNRERVLAFATIAVKKAARTGRTVLVNAEAARFLRQHPDCSISTIELQDEIARLGAQDLVTMLLS